MSKAKKQKFTMLSVFAVFCVLGLLYFWSTTRPEEDSPELEVVNPFLVQRPEEDVISVRVINDFQTMTLVPGMAEDRLPVWMIDEHPDMRIARSHTRDIVRSAIRIESQEVVLEYVENPAEYGLYPPVATVQTVFDDGTTSVVFIGTRTPDQRNRFAMVEGDPALHLVTIHSTNMFLTSLDHLIDRGLPPFDISGAQRVAIYRPESYSLELTIPPPQPGFPGPRMQRLEQPEWAVGTAFQPDQFQRHVLGFMDHFFIGQMVEFEPDCLIEFGLDTPIMEFYFDTGHRSLTLQFGERIDVEFMEERIPMIHVKFADSPHVFLGPYEPVMMLLNFNLFTFLDNHFAMHLINDVERVDITHLTIPERNLELITNHGHDDTVRPYMRPHINGQEVEEPAFRVAYRLLIQVPIMHSIEEPFYAEDEPEITVRFIYHNGEEHEYRFFVYDVNHFTVSVNGEICWFIVARRDVDAFFASIANVPMVRWS